MNRTAQGERRLLPQGAAEQGTSPSDEQLSVVRAQFALASPDDGNAEPSWLGRSAPESSATSDAEKGRSVDKAWPSSGCDLYEQWLCEDRDAAARAGELVESLFRDDAAVWGVDEVPEDVGGLAALGSKGVEVSSLGSLAFEDTVGGLRQRQVTVSEPEPGPEPRMPAEASSASDSGRDHSLDMLMPANREASCLSSASALRSKGSSLRAEAGAFWPSTSCAATAVGEGLDIAAAWASQASQHWGQQVTTVLLQNLPGSYNERTLLEEINADGFKGAINFLHVPPPDRRTGVTGHAVINFRLPSLAWQFKLSWDGRKLELFPPAAAVSVVPAPIQGFEANCAHFAALRPGTFRQRCPQSDGAQQEQHPAHAGSASSTGPGLGTAVTYQERAAIAAAVAQRRRSLEASRARSSCGGAPPQGPQPGPAPLGLFWGGNPGTAAAAAAGGRPFMVPRFCPRCGKPIQPDFQFCPSCGGSLPFDAVPGSMYMF